jgi:acetolactate synthase-1/2/3 large subunit
MISTYKAKGLLAEDDQLAMGGAGLSPKADKALMPLIAAADLILAIGYDPIEMRAGWREPWSRDKPVIEITPVPRLHSMHSATVEMVGAIAPALAELIMGTEPREFWPGADPYAVRKGLKADFAPEPSGWGPGVVFDVLRKALPRNTLATADSGAHRILLSQMWEVYEPRGLMQSSGLCTMGCALPLAMGRALAEPGRPIIAFMGDAGLEMTLGELATLRDLKLPVICCVLVDESLALIEMKQRNSQRGNLGVDFGGTDWPAVAKAMGGHGVWIDDAQTLAVEAKAALERKTFTILAPRIGRRAYDGKF